MTTPPVAPTSTLMKASSPSSSIPTSRCRPQVLVGVTGSVAAVKGPELAVRLVDELNSHVKVLLTRGAHNFWSKANDYNPHYWDALQKYSVTQKEEQESLPDEGKGLIEIISADEEWREWDRLGDPVMHIELRDWADIIVIAPLSAHTLAKFANGLCDDTLSCVMRAWDFGQVTRCGKPVVLAPAMNTAMWEHRLTATQLDTIVGFSNNNHTLASEIRIVPPTAVKTLACGQVGTGALAHVDEILEAIQQCLSRVELAEL